MPSTNGNYIITLTGAFSAVTVTCNATGTGGTSTETKSY
jgi:hypothetical protein